MEMAALSLQSVKWQYFYHEIIINDDSIIVMKPCNTVKFFIRWRTFINK